MPTLLNNGDGAAQITATIIGPLSSAEFLGIKIHFKTIAGKFLITQPIITFDLSDILAFSPGTPQHCYCVLITLSSLDFHNSGQHLLKLPSDCIVRHCTYNYIHYFHDILAQRQLKSSYRSGRNKLFNTIDFPNLHCF